jgi:hypothetical protein
MINNPKNIDNKQLSFLNIASKFVIVYLSLKVIIFPVAQIIINNSSHSVGQEKISADNIKIPDLTFPDIILLTIILLFQPQASKIFESLKLSPQGLEAQFKKLEIQVDENKENIDRLQQIQLDEMKKLQQFMYRLLLNSKELEKLEGLNANSLTEFRAHQAAAGDLRKLRQSKLIKIDRRVSEIEELSNYGEIPIDLTKYCAITKSGREFLMNLNNMTNSNKEEEVALDTKDS